MSINILADKYSQALFDIARSRKKQQVVLKELQDLHLFFSDNKEILRDISAIIVSRKAANKIIDKISHKYKLSQITTSFLNILINNRRLKFLSKIYYKYDHLFKKDAGELDFTLTSATKLTRKQLTELKKELEKITKLKVNFIEKIDTKLIGGFTMQCESLLVDNSTRSKLNDIKSIMLKELEPFEIMDK